MDLKEIRQIIELMKRHDLSLFHLERDGIKIKLRKGVDFETFVGAMQPGARGGNIPPGGGPPPPDEGQYLAAGSSGSQINLAGDMEETSVGGPTITAPMVGTFYRSSAPGDSPFIKEGDRISEGMTVCIIEAMKVMNEIKSETSGVLAKVLVNDATAVQYGQPMFELK